MIAPPTPGLIVASAVLETDHVPPGVASVSIIESPMHTEVPIDEIAAGADATVSIKYVEHPKKGENLIVSIPGEPASTIVESPMVSKIAATDKLLLCQIPSVEGAVCSVVVEPVHKCVAPVIIGSAMTVNVVSTVTRHPKPLVTVSW